MATPAAAQETAAVDLHALEPHGQWFSHSRWGEVWVPNVTADWQPYTNGRWVYTEEWGWYWASRGGMGLDSLPLRALGSRRSARLGLGSGPRMGPGVGALATEWRCRLAGRHCRRMRSTFDETVEADPRQWVFCPAHAVSAPRIAEVIVPAAQRPAYFRDTVLVNRALLVPDGGHRIGVNPGISPAYIAQAFESSAASGACTSARSSGYVRRTRRNRNPRRTRTAGSHSRNHCRPAHDRHQPGGEHSCAAATRARRTRTLGRYASACRRRAANSASAVSAGAAAADRGNSAAASDSASAVSAGAAAADRSN